MHQHNTFKTDAKTHLPAFHTRGHLPNPFSHVRVIRYNLSAAMKNKR